MGPVDVLNIFLFRKFDEFLFVANKGLFTCLRSDV